MDNQYDLKTIKDEEIELELPCEEFPQSDSKFRESHDVVDEASHYLKPLKSEMKLGNSGVKLNNNSEKPATRLPTTEDLPNDVNSSVTVDKQKPPTLGIAIVNVSTSNSFRMIDTTDRPAGVYAENKFARAVTCAGGGTDELGESISKAVAYAEAGVGRAGARVSILEVEAKGPSASAGVEASMTGVGAMARAELGSVSVGAGPFQAKLGLGLDTGASVGVEGFEIKFLGTGFGIGPKTSVSFLGSEVSFVI